MKKKRAREKFVSKTSHFKTQEEMQSWVKVVGTKKHADAIPVMLPESKTAPSLEVWQVKLEGLTCLQGSAVQNFVRATFPTLWCYQSLDNGFQYSHEAPRSRKWYVGTVWDKGLGTVEFHDIPLSEKDILVVFIADHLHNVSLKIKDDKTTSSTTFQQMKKCCWHKPILKIVKKCSKI